LSDVLSSDFTVWTLAGNLAQPILDGGRLRAGVKLADARSKQAAASYESAVLRAFGEVETALAAEQTLARREASQRVALAHARAAHDLAGSRYGEGLESFAIVLETQRRLLDAESQALAVKAQRWDNRINLHLALGGGFEVDLDATAPTEEAAQ
jgi:multidrug efflux system outer membrane protein